MLSLPTEGASRPNISNGIGGGVHNDLVSHWYVVTIYNQNRCNLLVMARLYSFVPCTRKVCECVCNGNPSEKHKISKLCQSKCHKLFEASALFYIFYFILVDFVVAVVCCSFLVPFNVYIYPRIS